MGGEGAFGGMYINNMRDLMNWDIFNYEYVYICICDTQHSLVSVHRERFKKKKLNMLNTI